MNGALGIGSWELRDMYNISQRDLQRRVAELRNMGLQTESERRNGYFYWMVQQIETLLLSVASWPAGLS